MSNDWLNSLTEAERVEWDAWIKEVAGDLVPKMESSAFVMSLVPSGKPDIKFCVELGMAIMLGKPIVAVASPGTDIPGKLREVCDEIIIGDMRTEEGREAMTADIVAVIDRMTGREKKNGADH